MLSHNLPIVPTPFVGRTTDIQAIRELLADSNCRLLTLVGPGGIGKTRLALNILQQLAEADPADYADGIYFIPLQALCDPNLILSTIGEELGLTFFQGINPQQMLLDYLCEKRMLLLLDNLEQLLDSMDAISAILACSPGIKLLATSREALNLQEEWLYTVGGMGIPTDDELAGFESFSAVRLFIQSARRVHPEFSVAQERNGIVRICSLVGGMPLGLELAAAWVRALSCDEIADEIAHNLSILETSARNMPERHRTMRGVLAQSWAMLCEDEQQVMMRLSVFQGGFAREAAEAVAGATMRVLSTLVDKSWLRWDSHDRRYDIHELLRQYGAEQLAAAGEVEAARHAHAAYFSAWMQKREGEIKFQRQDAALDDIECDFANVRLAWQWASDCADNGLINPMIEALNFFGDMRARFGEMQALFEQASERFARFEDSVNRLTYYRLRLRRSRMLQNSQTFAARDLEVLQAELESIIAALKPYDCPMETALALYQLGFTLSFRTFDGASRPYFEECLRIFSEAGDLFYKADAMHLLATTLPSLQEAKQYYEQAYHIQKLIGDRNGIGWSLTQLAHSNYLEHHYDVAETYNQQAQEIQRTRGDWKGLHYSLINGTMWNFRRGEGEAALASVAESLTVATTMHMLTPQRVSLATLGLILTVTETDVERGRALCEQVMSSSTPLVSSITEVEIDALNGLTIAAYHAGDAAAAADYYHQLVNRSHQPWISQTEYDQLINLGTSAVLVLDMQEQYGLAVEMLSSMVHIPDQPMLPDTGWLAKWPLAQRLRTKWEAKLGEAAYAAAWERGAARSQFETVTLLMSGFDMPASAADSPAPSATLPDTTALLTAREQDVLALLADGLSNREIAGQLVFSVGTVKWYVNQIYGKLGVRSRTQAVARARELRLLS